MISDPSIEVENVVRRSEAMAVVRALRSHHVPRLGDTLDYFIEVPGPYEQSVKPKRKIVKRYRFAVEQWHLDAATLLVTTEARAEL